MLSKCAGCQIVRDPSQLFSETSGFALGADGAGVSTDGDRIPLIGAVGSVEVTERSSRFVLVRNREGATYGPRTILLRGGSGNF